MNSTIHALSKRDANCLLELIHESLGCDRIDKFRLLIYKLKDLMTFDFATCLISKTGENGQIRALDIVNVNYPSEWIELYVANNYQQVDPILKKNFRDFRVQYWADTYRYFPPPKTFLSLAEDFGLDQGYTHGARNFAGDEGSLFSFSGRSLEHSERTATILNFAIPHLHEAFCRAAKYSSARDSSVLSRREKEVLQWMKQGKNTWEISRILCISERTVHFHVQNILQKLNASSRAHAVAIALEEGILELA